MRTPVAVIAALFASSTAAQAAAPATIPITGYLTDDAGLPIDGAVTLDLDLYGSPTDPTSLFHETQADVVVDHGQFTAYLGDVNALELALFRDHGTLYLGMSVDGGAPMTPRFAIGSAPYAAYAQYCDESGSVGGYAASDLALAGDPVNWSQITGVPADLADGDQDTTYDAASLTSILAGQYVQNPNVSCGADQVLLSDGLGGWSCGDVTLSGGSVAWGQLTGVPADLADGDQDTTYDAGAGITIVGTTISALAPNWSSIVGKPADGFLQTSRVIKGDAGATVAIGSLSNNGVGGGGSVHLRAHCSNTIENQTFDFAELTYTGTVTDWLELPQATTSASYYGNGEFTVDVYRAAIMTTSDPLFLRIRNKRTNSAGANCTVYVDLTWDSGQLAGAFTEASAQSTVATPFDASAAPAGGPVSGYFGGYEWNFPVSKGQGWASSNGAGLIVKNTGNVGIGTSAPAEALDVTGDMRASGAVYAGTSFGSTAKYGAAAATDVVYGQVWATGIVQPGGTSPTFNMNGLWVAPSNMGTFAILFSSDSAPSNNSYRYGVNVHGLGFNDFTTLAQRNDATYVINGTYPNLSFTNNSTANARYTIKVVPEIMQDPAHAGQ